MGKTGLNMMKKTVILLTHANGATIVETIKAVMVEYGVSLKEAKTLVSNNPVWSNVISATEPLIDEIYRVQAEDANGKN